MPRRLDVIVRQTRRLRRRTLALRDHPRNRPARCPARVRSAWTAARGLDATQRIRASVPQKCQPLRRWCRRPRPRVDDGANSRARRRKTAPTRRVSLYVSSLVFALREELALFPLGDVRAAPLDKVAQRAAREAVPARASGKSVAASRTRDRAGREDRKKASSSPLCGVAVSITRWRAFVTGEILQQLVTLVAPLPGCAHVCASSTITSSGHARRKSRAAPLALDVVETDDRVRVRREDALARRQIALQASGARRGDSDGLQMKMIFELPLPTDPPRCGGQSTAKRSTSPRSSNSRAISAASIVLPMPTSSAIEQPNRVELERHEQRHELVGPRLDSDLAETSKRPRAATKRQQQRIAQKQRRIVASLLRGVGLGERRVDDWHGF